MARIEILVGPVASGKSTYSRKRAGQGAIIVSNDSITTAVHGGNYLLYDKACKPLYKSIHVHMIHAGILSGRDVVVDDIHHTKDTRTRLALVAKSLGVDYNFVLFPRQSPEVHASRRFASDSRGLTYVRWLEIIKHHFEEWEPLTEKEQERTVYLG